VKTKGLILIKFFKKKLKRVILKVQTFDDETKKIKKAFK
jgi:hypothetical protein